jgi:hypothetical protein
MAEIATPLHVIRYGETFHNKSDDDALVIFEYHTLKDILRHLLTETNAEELIYFIKELSE